MGAIGAKASAYRGVSREAERAAGTRWVCPTCGPVGTPFHGSDEQMHCPELECDLVVSAAIHVEPGENWREQGKKSWAIAQAKEKAEGRTMGRVAAKWGSGITRREFDRLRKLASRHEMGKAIGLSSASIGNWVGGKGAPLGAVACALDARAGSRLAAVLRAGCRYGVELITLRVLLATYSHTLGSSDARSEDGSRWRRHDS